MAARPALESREQPESLPYHHQVLYELVRRRGPLLGTELSELYNESADSVYRHWERTPIGRRARYDTLKKLQEYDLIESDGTGKGAEYWVIEGSIESSV